MSIPERTGKIDVVTIQDILDELDIAIGEDIIMGDFDIVGWNTAAKIREPQSQEYKLHGAMFRPNYERGILIHSLIRKRGITKFLEIGFGRGYVTCCASKAMYDRGITGSVTTVDPNFSDTLTKNFDAILSDQLKQMITIEKVCKTSDDFFASLDPDEKFDLIFIDGDHRYNAVANDYNNAVKHIDRGYILMDDYHMPTKVDKDIDVANFIDTLPDTVSRRLVLTDRLLFPDDRGRTANDLDYGMVLIPVGDIEDEE